MIHLILNPLLILSILLSTNPLWTNTPQIYQSTVEHSLTDFLSLEIKPVSEVEPEQLPSQEAKFAPLGMTLAIAALSLAAASLNFAAECVKWRTLQKKDK